MLQLTLASEPGKVMLACDPAHASDLQRLRSRFADASVTSRMAVLVPIEDFLLNLRELVQWPKEDRDNFEWDDTLLRLLEQNEQDTTSLEHRLAMGQGADADAAVPFAAGWDANLTELQRESVDYLLGLGHGANFSVPGAGKTRTTLACYAARREAGQVSRMLVVCPKSAAEAWVTETAECLPEATIATMREPVLPATEIVLINYERLPTDLPALQQWLQTKPALLVLDEAHRMKRGATGAWGSACYALAPYAAHRLIMSGTPAPNGAQDLENLFGFVWPGRGRRIVQRATGQGDLAAAGVQLKPLFTRITKNQLELPPYDPQYRTVRLPPLHREIYDALVGASASQYEANLNALGRVSLYLLMAATTPALLATGSSQYEPLEFQVPPLAPPAGSPLAALMHDLPDYELSPKYAEAAAIIQANAEKDRKTLVWSTFVRSITSLQRFLARYHPAVIHGGTEDREAELRRFRQDPDCMVLISNPATLGEGVSLHHECHEAIYIDRDFAAGRYLQSLDRIHRLGLLPGTETRFTILIAERTIDEVVHQRLEHKVRFLEQILDDPSLRRLTDLDEAPTSFAALDPADRQALLDYLIVAHGQ